MKQINISQISNATDVALLAHHIVHNLHRPDYHPDDFFGDSNIDRLVDEAFEVCGEKLYGIFYDECMKYLKREVVQEFKQLNLK